VSDATIGLVARRAFYAAMKDSAPSDALWSAAADAIVEHCAVILEGVADTLELEPEDGRSVETDALRSGAKALRAIKDQPA
jgi:hypothetical protein